MNIEPLQHTIVQDVRQVTRNLFSDLIKDKETLDLTIDTIEIVVLNSFLKHGFPAPKPNK